MAYTNIIGGGWATNGVPLLPQLMGIPFGGRYIFVDAVSGSDGNEGTADSPMQSIPAAYNVMTEGQNDVLLLVQRPTTSDATVGTFRLSAALVWAKSACHMVGVTAPTMIGQRARISTATGATLNINPLITVSAQGCYFANFSVFQGVGQSSTAEQLGLISGQRNCFANIAFQGIASTNGGGQSASYVLSVTGVENTFKGCTIGVDTAVRAAANTSVQFRSGGKRNIFLDCIFPMWANGTTATFIDANAANSIDRFNLFKNCLFHNTGISVSPGTVIAAVVTPHQFQNGHIIIDNCTAVSCTDWTAADSANVVITGPVPNGDTSGMAVASDTT